jgi:hypothetical protein
MRVTIMEVRTHCDRVEVAFQTSVGITSATWRGAKPPQTGVSLDAELDIDDTIEKGRSAHVADQAVFSLTQDDHRTVLIGYVESVDEDGMVYFRVAEDCLLMVEAAVGVVSEGEWLRLRFENARVQLYPQGG